MYALDRETRLGVIARKMACTPSRERLPRPEAVLFDWDDTLANCRGLYRHAAEDCLRDLAKEEGTTILGETGFRKLREQGRLPSNTVQAFFRELHDQLHLAHHDELIAKYVDVYTYYLIRYFDQLHGTDACDLHVLDGTKKTLETLIHQKIPVAIVSNGPERYVRHCVRAMLGDAIADHIVIIGTHAHEVGKPERDTVDRALEELKARHEQLDISRTERMYFVGDTEHCDLAVAHHTGMKGVLIDRPHAPEEERSCVMKGLRHQHASGSVPVHADGFIHVASLEQLNRLFSYVTRSSFATASR